MKTCISCIFYQPDNNHLDSLNYICTKLSGKNDKEKNFKETGIAAYPICEHDGLAYTYYVSHTFGCTHHIKRNYPFKIKTCDLCGNKFIGENIPLYDENFHIERGIITCGCHLLNDKDE